MKVDKKILRSLLPGLLPLFIFVIADELWGTLIGLYVAIVFGLAEFIYTLIKFRKVEKFILLDLGLLVLLGSISILLNDDIFFKLKPAFIELVFAIILGISVFSPRNIIFEMSSRYLKGMTMTSEAENKFNFNLKIVFYITVFHIGLIVYSSYYMSKESWVFISGVLFYLLVFGYFGIDFLLIKYRKKDPELDEVLPVVDIEGKVIGKSSRKDFHFNPVGKILHPVVHMHVINLDNEIYLQHRALTKKVQPGKWDTAVGGHVAYGEDLEHSLKREAEEEIGLLDFVPKFILKYVWETEVEKELVFMFICQTDKTLKANPLEISEGRFWSFEEVKNNIGKGIFTENFEKEFLMLSTGTVS